MYIRINQTGIRNGETIMAATGRKQCSGTIMKIRGYYPPSSYWIKKLSPEEIRDRFNNYTFFTRMNPEQRKGWLESNSISNDDLYLEDVPDLHVKFINIAGDFILKALTQEQIDLLLAGNPEDPEGYWSIKYVYDLIPRKAGSKANKHTLIFRPSNWSLKEDVECKPEIYSGIAIHLESGDILNGDFNTNEYHGFYIIKSPSHLQRYAKEIAIISSISGSKLTYSRLEGLCEEIGLNVSTMRDIYPILEWAPPSLHKSLIQKILRTRCTHVEWLEKEYPAREVLATSFCMLAVHPGAFVPNIQRFVSGLESALKRMAVAICEDAFLENNAIITSLLAGAWIAQNNENIQWYPSDDILKVWIYYGLKSLDYPYMFDYDWHSVDETPSMGQSENEKIITIPEWTPLYMSYFLLANIQSFDSDVKMVASIAERKGAPTSFMDIRDKRVMPMIHAIDQHSFTSIAHYVPYDMLKSLGNYNELFTRIWKEVVGANPRKSEYANFEFMNNTSYFFNIIRDAQKMIWISHIYTPQILPVTNNIQLLEYNLNPSWLASFIGPIEIKVKKSNSMGYNTAIVMMNPDNLLQFSAIKRPSRDKSPIDLTNEEKNVAIEAFKQKLRNGMKFVNVPPTLSMFKNCIVYLTRDDSEYMINLNGQIIDWFDVVKLKLQFPLHPPFSTDNYLYTALTLTGSGIRENSIDVFRKYILELPLPILQRATIYFGYNAEIELYHIARNGKGVEYSVTIEDTGVNHLLSVMASLFPVAIVNNKFKYTVKNGPLMWLLSDMIFDRIKDLSPKTVGIWSTPKPETRKLFEHQIEAIENLMETKHIKRARIIWLPVGVGKTAIIANYISNQIVSGKMNRYCLYTMPPAAFKTVKFEFSLLGIPFVHLDMRTTSKTPKELLPGIVNVVYHDHLRMLNLEKVKQIAPEMLFVVDEFHNTLNATIRTSTALEIAHLADDVIALTGTLIKDSHIEPIITWLSMAVNFEVTTKNYWVALSSIISRKVRQPVPVDRVVIDAPMNEDEQQRYYDVVPSNLGGRANKINFKQALEISYESVTRCMIDVIIFHIENGLGVFVVAVNIHHQHFLKEQLFKLGITNIFLIGKDHSINLTPTEPSPEIPVPQVVITTPSHREGYNMTRYMVMIMPVLLKNITVQQQLEGRINRLSQTADEVRVVLIHSGILTYIHRHHEYAQRLSDTIKQFAREFELDIKDIDY